MSESSAPLTISVLGVTLPISRWSVSGFSLLALAAVGLIIYRQAVPTELVSIRQANSALALEVNEYGIHISDTPERVFADPDGSLTVQVYADHCVAIQRRSKATGVQTRLIPDPARLGIAAPTIGTHGAVAILPVVSAAGRCLNPHPGQFTTSYGQKNGCVVAVWRTWADGCAHYQMMDICRNVFESNQDGSPKVTWSRCVH